MPSFNKFNQFPQDLGRKVHDLNADTLKVMLTNIAPLAANAVKADITELAAANGYPAGGVAIASQGFAQTGGVGKLTGNAVTFTATGGSIGPFRYAVLYNDTPTSPVKPLIGWADYGSPITLLAGQFITLEAADLGNWDADTPLLTLN